MPRSRMIKTLAVLLASMTAGTFLLEALYPGPNPFVPLAARNLVPANRNIEEIYNAPAILAGQERDWVAVVVHDCPPAAVAEMSRKCHFLITANQGAGPGGPVRSTECWRTQVDGGHLRVPGSDVLSRNSVGVCLVVDSAEGAPTDEQMQSLRSLVQSLQRRYRIQPERVYLHRDLAGGASPGPAFAAQQFRRGLLHTP